MTYYIAGGSVYDSSSYKVYAYCDDNGYPDGDYGTRTDANMEDDDAYWRLGGSGGEKIAEIGLHNSRRIKITTTTIEGWDGSQWVDLLSSGASQLSDLSDVGSVTYTAGFVLRADGDSYEAGYLQWGDVANKPTEFTPISHNNDYHSVAFVDAAGAITAVEGEPTLTLGAQVSIDGSGWLEGGTTPSGTIALMYNGYFYATRVYNAVYNDYADYWKRAPFTKKIPGMCYSFLKGKGLILTNKRADKACMGICTDTYGHAVGDIKNGIPISIGGFVLAYCDKEYDTGDLLVPNAEGVLTLAIKKEILEQKTIAKYMYKEEKIMTKRVKVKGRHWVKVI